MATLLIRNARPLVTMDDARREIEGGGVFVRDNAIEVVGACGDCGGGSPTSRPVTATDTPSISSVASNTTVVDCAQQRLIVGFIAVSKRDSPLIY